MTTEVLVYGTFNIVHAGHVRLLEFACRYGKVTVGINADAYLRNKYGDDVVPLIDRSYVLESNKYVNNVVIFREDEPSALIYKLKPKYIVKGPDYIGKDLPEQVAIDAVGAHLILQPIKKEYNSSDLVASLSKDIAKAHSSAFKKLSKFG